MMTATNRLIICTVDYTDERVRKTQTKALTDLDLSDLDDADRTDLLPRKRTGS